MRKNLKRNFRTYKIALSALLLLAADRVGAAPLLVEDQSQLTRAEVVKILKPTSVAEIQAALRSSTLPLSIGGARFSQGGQIASEQTLFIDMSSMNRVLEIFPKEKRVRVEAGATWRDLIDAIDPKNLAPKIMQSYANFSIGGSLSVNAHGRYFGLGALIKSVRSIKVVLADGKLVEANRDTRSDLFRAVIGGYGGLGVISEATLELEDNIAIERKSQSIRVRDFPKVFKELEIRQPVLFSADIYAPDFSQMAITTFEKTEKPLTIDYRLPPRNQGGWSNDLASKVATSFPFHNAIRRKIVDPARLSTTVVTLRNAEASQDVSRLGVRRDEKSAYLLQEYFVPVEKFAEFVAALQVILRSAKVQVANIAVRHAKADTESTLSWCRKDCFAFVLYYRQPLAESEEETVWTRQLIQAAIKEGGSFYLPYRIQATSEQFETAYPDFEKFLQVKKLYDPKNRFRNKLWDKYYREPK